MVPLSPLTKLPEDFPTRWKKAVVPTEILYETAHLCEDHDNCMNSHRMRHVKTASGAFTLHENFPTFMHGYISHHLFERINERQYRY